MASRQIRPRAPLRRYELDIEYQRELMDQERRRRHDDWMQRKQAEQRFTHHGSIVRAKLLIAEAYRHERMHLQHQYDHCKRLIAKQMNDVHSPPRVRCEASSSRSCACLKAPVFRQLTTKFRAMNILLSHFESRNLEQTVDTILSTYRNENDVIEDLLSRYGPEPEVVDPKLWMRTIKERQAKLEAKWRDIAEAVDEEMYPRDNFQSVIRSFSVMRIFLEGAQSPTYSCDSLDRCRRDSLHRSVLEELEESGALFLRRDRNLKRLNSSSADDEDDEEGPNNGLVSKGLSFDELEDDCGHSCSSYRTSGRSSTNEEVAVEDENVSVVA